MTFDEGLAQRVRELLPEDAVEKRMFGGVAWMDRGNLVCGVLGEDLIARVGPGRTEAALDEPHTRPFDVTGRPMKGFVYVDADGTAEDEDLEAWVERSREFVGGLPGK